MQQINSTHIGYKERTVFLIVIAFIIHLVLAAVFQLGNDEAYYWFYTQRLQWNYFDHPPMVALWSRIFSLNLLLQNELFIRLGSVIGAALSNWFIFRCVSELYSQKAGWYAAVLYNTGFYASIIAGVFIMPDAPQMIFWTCSMWMAVKITTNEKNWWYWLLFGAASGLCVMSKVHGAFLWAGFLLYCLFHKKAWFKYPHLYLSLLLCLLITSPIIIWNFQNDFVTYRFHSERVIITGATINIKNFLQEFFGQILFNNPFNVVLTVLSLVSIKQAKHHTSLSFFKWAGLPLALILLVVSLFRPIYPHWSGPGYVSLIPWCAVYLAEKKNLQFPSLLKWSIGGYLVFIMTWPLITYKFPGTYGSKREHNYGWSDVTLDRYGWKEAGKVFADFYRQQISKNNVPANAPLVYNTWWGAHVEYYFARPAGATMIGLGGINEIHHYAWTNTWRKSKVNMQLAFAIVPSDEYYDVTEAYGKYYHHIQRVQIITIFRSNKKARSFFVYQLRGWKSNLPEVH